MHELVPANPTQPAAAGSSASPVLGATAAQPVVSKHANARVGKQMRQQFEAFAGPLPHPDHFAAYDNAVPGSGSRILAMAERQSAHRQQLEDKVVTGNLVAQKMGIVAATVLALAITGGGVWLVHDGKSLEGMSALIAAIGSLVGIFIYGSRRQIDEQAKKRAKAQ